MRLAPVLLLAPLLACSSGSLVPDDGGVPLAVTRLSPGPLPFAYYTGLPAVARVVVRDAAHWQQVWTKIHENLSPKPALPAVNFAEEIIVVVGMGLKPSGGYGIFVQSARQTDEGVVVNVLSVSPGASCFTTGAITAPVDIARLPKREGTVVFAESSATNECE